MKNVIPKRSSKLNQSEYSDRALLDNKAQHLHLARNCYQMLFSRWFFVNMTTVSLNFSLRVAKPLGKKRVIGGCITWVEHRVESMGSYGLQTAAKSVAHTAYGITWVPLHHWVDIQYIIVLI